MSLYSDLGVDADVDADAIRKAHRKGVRKHHPDNQETGDREAFDKVQRAYLILRDPKLRERYDRTGEEEVAPDNELGEIANIIVNCFDQTTAMTQEKYDFADLASILMQVIGQRRDNAEVMRNELQEGKSQIEKLLRRLRFKGDGPDVIAATLKGRLADNLKAQAQLAHEIEMLDRAKAYAADYGYDFEAPPSFNSSFKNDPWRPIGPGGFFRNY